MCISYAYVAHVISNECLEHLFHCTLFSRWIIICFVVVAAAVVGFMSYIIFIDFAWKPFEEPTQFRCVIHFASNIYNFVRFHWCNLRGRLVLAFLSLDGCCIPCQSKFEETKKKYCFKIDVVMYEVWTHLYVCSVLRRFITHWCPMFATYWVLRSFKMKITINIWTMPKQQ